MTMRTLNTSLIAILALALAPGCSAQGPSATAVQTISIGTEEFVVDPSNVILDGTTISAGGPAVTVNNEPVSMDVADDLFVGPIEVLTGHTAIVDATSSAPGLKNGTSSLGARNLSSFTSTEASISTGPQDPLDTQLLQGFLAFLQTASASPQASQSRLPVTSTAESVPQSSSMTSQFEGEVNGNVATSAASSAASLSDSTILRFQSTIQPQNVTSAPAATTAEGLSGQNTDRGTGTPNLVLGNSMAPDSSSLVATSSSSVAALAPIVNTTSGTTTFAPAAGSIPTTSGQANIAAASSSVIILAGALLSFSASGKSLSDRITLPPTKTSFIQSIETIEADLTNLETLLKGLGGKPVVPPSCHASKNKSRFKQRSLMSALDNILSNVECAVQDLGTLSTNLKAVPPFIDDIGPSLDDLGTTASDMEKSDDDDDDDDDDDATSADSPSQTRTSPGSQIMTSFESTVQSSVSSSSAISSQSTTDYPCYSGLTYVEPASTSDDPAELSAFNALLPSLLSSEFDADLSGFVTVAANATSSVNATSALTTNSIVAGEESTPAPPTTSVALTSISSIKSPPSSRQTPIASPTVTVAPNVTAVLGELYPHCSMVLANAGDGCAGVDYCDCSSTYAPLLTSTVDGSLTSGCSYATQVSPILIPIPTLINQATTQWKALAYHDT